MGDILYGLKSESGDVLWKKRYRGIGYSDPKVLKDTVLISGLDQLLIVNPTNGEMIHRYGFLGNGYDFAWNSEAAVVVVNSDSEFENYTGKGRVVCFKHRADKPLWQTALGGACHGTIVCDDQRCYFGGRDGRFYAIKMEDGSIAWQIDCAAFFRDGGAVWADGYVLISGSSVVFSVGHPSIDAPSVLVSAEKKTGKVVWSTQHETSIDGRFTETRGSNLAATQDRKLLLVKTSDGTLQNVYSLPKQRRGEFAGVALDRDHAFVVGADARVWRIPLEEVRQNRRAGAAAKQGTIRR